MEKNNLELSKVGIESGTETSPRAIGPKSSVTPPRDFKVLEPDVPFTPDLEVIPELVETVGQDAVEPMLVDPVEGVSALQKQFEGSGTTAAGPAHRTVVEFTNLRPE